MPKHSKVDPDDAPHLPRKWFTRADRIPDGPEALREYLEQTRRRGPQRAPTKQLVSLRLSREVIAAYRGTGRGWQSRIDEDLKKAAKRIRAPR